MSADFATVFGWLEAAESDNGPRGYLGDLLRFFAGDPGDGAAEEGRGRHSRTVRPEIDFGCCEEAAAGGVPFELLSPGRRSQAISALTPEGEELSGRPPTMTAAGGRPSPGVVDAAK